MIREPIFFIENRKYSYTELGFKLESEKIKKLLSLGIIETNFGNYFTFSFVGLFTIGPVVVCVLPKYICEDGLEIKKMALVLRVLQKYNANLFSMNKYESNNEDTCEISLLSVAEYILRDYLLYGYYSKIEKNLYLNGNGEISWQSTIDQVNPVFVGGSPYYLDTVNQEIVETETVIRKIHKWAVCCSYAYFGKLLNYEILDVDLNYTELGRIGSEDYLLAILKRELNNVYSDRQINILNAIRVLINCLGTDTQDKIILNGTKYFHTVWEKACGVAFANEFLNYASFIPSPRWVECNGGNQSLSDRTLRPDIIRTAKDEKDSAFLIIDAKYYNTGFKNGEILNNPGVGDVSKQILYAKALEEVVAQYKMRYNVFVFPHNNDSDYNVLGTVSLDFLSGESIILLRLSAENIFRMYLDDRSFSDEAVFELCDHINNLLIEK